MNFNLLQELLGSSAFVRPTEIMATVFLMVYLMLRLMGLTQEPMMPMFLTNVRGNGIFEDWE